jgi:hypothetical protein
VHIASVFFSISSMFCLISPMPLHMYPLHRFQHPNAYWIGLFVHFIDVLLHWTDAIYTCIPCTSPNTQVHIASVFLAISSMFCFI